MMLISPSDHLRAIASVGGTNKQSLLFPPQQPPATTTTTTTSTSTMQIRDAQLDGYTMEAVNAVRQNDLSRLRTLFQQGHCLDACNTNGESLLHLACRRSTAATVQFLVTEARVNVYCRDGMGRSILHDLCWRPEPSLDVMDIVLLVVPPQLWWAVDARGHSCWDYCRRSDWETWNQYLSQRHERIAQRIRQQQPKEHAGVESSAIESEEIRMVG